LVRKGAFGPLPRRKASANLFSLVMTARANGVEPFEYLSELFERLPAAATLEAIEELVPWNVKPVLDGFKLDR
jgi:hypothetical protein